jgi:hypothetical protein
MVYAIYGDHNPYSILHIPYSMLYEIYDLEGSNDVNLQSTEFDPYKNITICFGSEKVAILNVFVAILNVFVPGYKNI